MDILTIPGFDMTKSRYIMFGDIVVMKMNFKTNDYTIYSEKHLPYMLRGRVVDVQDPTDGMSIDEIYRRDESISRNITAIINWVSDRTLMLSRTNAKRLFNMLSFPQSDDKINRLRIALTCRAVSVLDKYWIKDDDEDTTWEDIDLKHNHLNDIITQVALHGSVLTFRGSYTTPELTTNGSYAKAWKNKHNDLYLYKLGAKDGASNESRVEVMVSNILDKCEVNHVHYEADSDNGKYVCMCPCMSSNRYSIVSAYEYFSYCFNNVLDLKNETLKIDADGFYKMCIVDYLICNEDRHQYNWGFYMDNETMSVVSLHPLFDHNLAFTDEWMNDDSGIYDPTGDSIRSSAEWAIGNVSFTINGTIGMEDFLRPKQYYEFIKRANILGIQVSPGKLTGSPTVDNLILVAKFIGAHKRLVGSFSLEDISAEYLLSYYVYDMTWEEFTMCAYMYLYYDNYDSDYSISDYRRVQNRAKHKIISESIDNDFTVGINWIKSQEWKE